VTPEEFQHWKQFGLSIGLGVVESGPLVRSSYHADEQSQKYTGAVAPQHAERVGVSGGWCG
jgi:lipoic acid synthetase